jgi:hypothetical protein
LALVGLIQDGHVFLEDTIRDTVLTGLMLFWNNWVFRIKPFWSFPVGEETIKAFLTRKHSSLIVIVTRPTRASGVMRAPGAIGAMFLMLRLCATTAARPILSFTPLVSLLVRRLVIIHIETPALSPLGDLMLNC